MRCGASRNANRFLVSCHYIAAAKAMVVALRVQVLVATRPVCGDGKCVLKRQLHRAACGSRAGKRCEDRVDRIRRVRQRGRLSAATWQSDETEGPRLRR